MINEKKFYIDGAWVDPQVDKDFDVINPSTEQVCATISIGGQADTDAAVAAAKAALGGWSATGKQEKLTYLESLLEAYSTRAAELAEAMSIEMGAPITMAVTAQVESGREHIASTIEAFREFKFEHPLDDINPDYGIVHEPIGVAALITPWNWPMNQVTLKVVPAAAAGCSGSCGPPGRPPG